MVALLLRHALEVQARLVHFVERYRVTIFHNAPHGPAVSPEYPCNRPGSFLLTKVKSAPDFKPVFCHVQVKGFNTETHGIHSSCMMVDRGCFANIKDLENAK